MHSFTTFINGEYCFFFFLESMGLEVLNTGVGAQGGIQICEIVDSFYCLLKKILQTYKNIVHQEAGINKEILHWVANEA